MVVAIIVINVLVFFWELSLDPRQLDAAIEVLGFVPRRFFGWEQAGRAPLDPWRFLPLLTANFLHGGWLHIIGNMWFLGVFGDNVEDRLGHLRFVIFYLLCGAASMLIQGLVIPGSRIPAIGASGAIAGVLGAYLILYPSARVRTLVIIFIVDLPAVVFLGVWFLTQLMNGSASLSPTAAEAAAGVAWWAHIGGFVVGMVLCLLLRRNEVPRPRRDWTTRPPRGLWV
jgi:membrane associated rhomboid family serine protease